MDKIENIKIKMCNKAKVQENSQSIEFLLILLVRDNKTIFDWRSAIFSSKTSCGLLCLICNNILFNAYFYVIALSLLNS